MPVRDGDGKGMDGRVAVITGGTQGLGEAAARLLAKRGAAGIVICGRNVERGRAVADEMSSAGCPTRFVRAELERVEDCENVIAEADRAFGKIDCLVNSAGVTDRGSIWDTTPELWDRIFAVNVRAPFLLMQGAARIMRREGIAGSMVNVISISGYGGQSFLTPYAASKGALATLTRNVAYSLLSYRIRVNGINLGWTATPGEDQIQKQYHAADDNWLDEAGRRQPFGRLIEPDEVARAIYYLVSDESGLMTGSLIDFAQSVLGTGDAPPKAPPREPAG